MYRLDSEIPKVSVLIPVYNVEKYLGQCLDSVVNQTLKEIEIICINDGSTDKSPEIIKRYAEKDKRIKVINKKNSGYGATMNQGLKKASGEYIGIVESDDFAERNMFETLYNLAKANDLDIARSEFYYYDNNKKEDKKSDCSFSVQNKIVEPKKEKSIFYQQPSIWASIYRKDFLVENEIVFLETPGASYQDTSFTFKVYESAKKYMMIETPLIHYRTFAGSSSFVGNSKIYCVCDEYNEIEKYLKERNKFDEYADLFYHLKFNAYRWNYYRLDSPYDQEFAKKWKDEFKKANDEGYLKMETFCAKDAREIKELLSTGTLIKGPKVSIIIPVYNSEKYLRTCLDSVINQTLKEIEIICVNDGSTDSSRSILTEYEQKDKRIKIVDKNNGGLSSARNAGMAVAKCEFICFLDSDDWVIPETYEACLNNIGESDIAIFGTKVIGDYLKEEREKDQRYYDIKYSGYIKLDDDIRLNIDVSAWDKMYRKSIIDKLNLKFPEGLLYEDYYFFWIYISKCSTAYFDKKYYHRYLRHADSIMANTFSGSKRAREHIEILDRIFSKFDDESDFNQHGERNNSMFLNCFWFSYQHSPDNKKIKVLKKGTKIVKKYNLKGQKDIDALQIKDYETVDTSKSYTLRVRFLKFIFDKIENATSTDLTSFKASIYNTRPSLESRGLEYTTTMWVQDHEIRYGVERWSIVYDSGSINQNLNWDMKNGLMGGSAIEIPEDKKRVFSTGTEIKVLATIWGAEVTVMHGIILNPIRCILGGSFYDGTSTFIMSIDIQPEKSIMGRAVLINNGQDISNQMKILKIESRVY